MLILFFVQMKNDYSTVWNNEYSSDRKSELVKPFLKLLTVSEYFGWNGWYWTNYCFFLLFVLFRFPQSLQNLFIGGNFPQPLKQTSDMILDCSFNKLLYGNLKLSWFWNLYFLYLYNNQHAKTLYKLHFLVYSSQDLMKVRSLHVVDGGMVCFFFPGSSSPPVNSFLTGMKRGRLRRGALISLTLLCLGSFSLSLGDFLFRKTLPTPTVGDHAAGPPWLQVCALPQLFQQTFYTCLGTWQSLQAPFCWGPIDTPGKPFKVVLLKLPYSQLLCGPWKNLWILFLNRLWETKSPRVSTIGLTFSTV